MKSSVLASTILLFTTLIASVHATTPTSAPDKTKVNQALAALSIPFEENQGQADARVAFSARTLAGPLFITKNGEIVWNLTPHYEKDFIGPPAPSYSVVENFVNGNAKPTGTHPSETHVSYFHGNDKSKWQSNISTWEAISLGEVWQGISINIVARGKNAEKIFTVASGNDASAIELKIAAGKLEIEKDGGLKIENDGNSLLTFTPPVAWQIIDGKRKFIQVAYRMVGEKGELSDRYGFSLGEHDPSRPVIIDPLIQSTYLGGSDYDWANALAVTADAVFVAGETQSSNFPGTGGGAQGSFGGGYDDAFVARLSKDLLAATRLTVAKTGTGSGTVTSNPSGITHDAFTRLLSRKEPQFR
ncbi:exported hypothetical protein [Gammaproteobacteria bacterium]